VRVFTVLAISISLLGCRPKMVASGLPDAPPIDARVAAAVRTALAAKGPGYVPRTRHLVAGAPKFTNRLILESSPYLLQHAHNPVDWHVWGEAAFAEAKRRGVPVFLSIGYSTCHWCHVMEVESFEDEEIARFMNRHYVCIKVDREERPDVDAVYMSAVQALTRSGGWPMSVWLTPAREPFFGGTYFPARDGDRGARHGFLTLLQKMAASCRDDRDAVAGSAKSMVEAVRIDLESGAGGTAASGEVPGTAAILNAVAALRQAFDEQHGGTRRAPKFPSNMPVRLLLRANRRAGDSEALRMATVTLHKMAAGGIHDHVGGGFHRYATDAEWLVPHFEKMLYDNALLAAAYVEAFQTTGDVTFARVARRTLDYLLREMVAPSGGLYSATDADSEGEEGRFFVWSEAEIRSLLGGDAERVIAYYGVTRAGNFEGHNILHAMQLDEVAEQALERPRARLYEARGRRVAPARDDKILAAWNGLAISALALAGRVLDERRYVDTAARAAGFVLDHMRPQGRLARSSKDGKLGPPGYLEDHAFVAAGLFDLYETSFDPRWLREALTLVAETDANFGDATSGGWFTTAAYHDKLFARERPQSDGATPSGTSVAILNALRAATFTGDDHFRASADRALAALRLEERPLAMTEALLALDYRTDAAREIAIVWPSGGRAADAEPLLAVLRRTFVPNKALASGSERGLAELAKTASFVEGKRAIGGRATAYVCERGKCELPTNDPAVFARQLSRVKSY
jgi:uncharacterized protein YyaL (SSP411 family)